MCRNEWEGLRAEPGGLMLRPLRGDWTDNVLHTGKGDVSCRCPETGAVRAMAFQGLKAERDALKHRCPAAAYGLECAGRTPCSQRAGAAEVPVRCAGGKPAIRQAIDFYQHRHNWSNRLIAGDSLLVMNSLLEKEGLGGKVQMVYIDPPYGIRYGSNFQPFVNKKEAIDGRDEDLTREPETIRAFRDAWELGIAARRDNRS